MAANAHIVKGPDVSVSGNSLTVTAGIAGLGNVPSADFTLSGTVDVFSRCYNRGGNKPQADNKQETLAVNSTEHVPGAQRPDQRVVHGHAPVDADLPREPGSGHRVVQLRPAADGPGHLRTHRGLSARGRIHERTRSGRIGRDR